jgi:hypothetical protein
MEQGTKEWAKFVFRQEMKPCPKCKSYNMWYQNPIKLKEKIPKDFTAKQLLGIWARSIKEGKTPLEGPCYMSCRDCGHKGPSIDCSGRTSEDVGKDPIVAKKIKDLWNNQ